MSHEHTLKCGDLTEKIIGVFYDVYNELGYGFLESVYQEALVMALREAGLAVECQVPVPVWFRRQKVGDFRADLSGKEGSTRTKELSRYRSGS